MRFRASHHAASLLVALSLGAASGQSGVTGTALAGHEVPLLPPKTRIAALFFIASDCPISNRYQPEMLRLEHAYGPRGVAFWFVYPNLTETVAGIRSHQAAFADRHGLTHVLIDPNQKLTRLTGAKVTPEAAILVSESPARTVYAGRIDDRYLSIGNERPQAGHHDLEAALTAALAGDPIPQPAGPPVGCGIVSTR